MSDMAEVLKQHHISPLNEGGWFCFNCGLTIGAFYDAIDHQSSALSAAGFGRVSDR